MNTAHSPAPLLSVRNVGKRYGDRVALQGASFDLWPGEVLAVVGESGSGKSTLLNAIAARSAPDEGTVQFRQRNGELQDVYAMSEAQQRLLARTDWGFVHQNAADGLRMDVSAGANVGERRMGLDLQSLVREAKAFKALVDRLAARAPAFAIEQGALAGIGRWPGGLRQRRPGDLGQVRDLPRRTVAHGHDLAGGPQHR